jgi:hypothetical protein
MLSDTHPSAEQVQVDLLRKATSAERLAKSLSLTATVVDLSRRAIARANPHLDRHEVDMLWVELNYGKDLAKRLRDYVGTKRELNNS